MLGGRAVGNGVGGATEWRGGHVFNLARLPGSTGSSALGINDAGQVVGQSVVGGVGYATEWRGGRVINLEGLPGSRVREAPRLAKPSRRRGEPKCIQEVKRRVEMFRLVDQWSGGTRRRSADFF